MTQPAQPPDRKHGEPLTKMSVGDHLDELRRRLMICIGSVGVCVLVMMGFKTWVTEVYIQPYRICWRMAYLDYLEFRDQQFQSQVRIEPSSFDGQVSIQQTPVPPAQVLPGVSPGLLHRFLYRILRGQTQALPHFSLGNLLLHQVASQGHQAELAGDHPDYVGSFPAVLSQLAQ